MSNVTVASFEMVQRECKPLLRAAPELAAELIAVKKLLRRTHDPLCELLLRAPDCEWLRTLVLEVEKVSK